MLILKGELIHHAPTRATALGFFYRPCDEDLKSLRESSCFNVRAWSLTRDVALSFKRKGYWAVTYPSLSEMRTAYVDLKYRVANYHGDRLAKKFVTALGVAILRKNYRARRNANFTQQISNGEKYEN